MKYFLAIDKGKHLKNGERFKKIDLSFINNHLIKDNNLKAICAFTATFNTPSELKEFLQRKGLMSAKDSSYNLKIIYNNKGYNRSLRVAYKSDQIFMDYRYLEDVIFKNAYSPEFLNSLIEYYKNYTQLREELAAFRHPKKEYKLYDLVRMFVYKICFRENNGQNKLNYRGMYELGMLISKLTKEETREERKKEKREDSSIFQMNLDENSQEYHHLEELKDRAKKNDDDQMRLF